MAKSIISIVFVNKHRFCARTNFFLCFLTASSEAVAVLQVAVLIVAILSFWSICIIITLCYNDHYEIMATDVLCDNNFYVGLSKCNFSINVLWIRRFFFLSIFCFKIFIVKKATSRGLRQQIYLQYFFMLILNVGYDAVPQ